MRAAVYWKDILYKKQYLHFYLVLFSVNLIQFQPIIVVQKDSSEKLIRIGRRMLKIEDKDFCEKNVRLSNRRLKRVQYGSRAASVSRELLKRLHKPFIKFFER